MSTPINRKVTIGQTRVCSPEYGVTRVTSSGGEAMLHRREPCEQCPWRTDLPPGVFPPDAFRTSAHTAYDAAQTTFACHMSGAKAPAVCAGFLLRHGRNNIGVRLAIASGRFDPDSVRDGGHPLYPDYRAMAVTNGVSPDDPVLHPIRGDDDTWDQVSGTWTPPCKSTEGCQS